MGFDCGLYKVKKFNNLSFKQIRAIGRYYDYYNNDWAQKNYKTWQDYCTNYSPDEYDINVSSDDIEAYKDEYIQREYNKSIYRSYEDWCSNGTAFHDWFMEVGEKINDYMVILSKENILGALDYCSMTLQSMTFKPVIIERAFTEDEETEVITSIPCVGVEVMDEEGNIKREYSNSWEYSNIFVPTDGYFEEEKYNAFTRLLDALICILMTTDFDNEIVFYEGGW